MPQKIFPGNIVRNLSSYEDQPAVSQPGRIYYQKIGYGLITSLGGTVFPITIPSPDLRADDKPRPDIIGLVIPAGARVYKLGLRVPDVRRDRSLGIARSGLAGTNTNRLKLASAVGTAAGGVIDATNLGTNSADVVVANGAIAPVASSVGLATPATLSGALTLSLYSTATGGTTAGSSITSSEPGGTPVIVECCWFVEDAVPDLDDINLPFRVEN